MIDRELYQAVLSGEIENRSVEELEALVTENPWFSLGHMALAKRYFDSNHSGYTDQLGKAAVYVGSPSILYDLIMEPEKIAEQVAIESAPATEVLVPVEDELEIAESPIDIVEEAEVSKETEEPVVAKRQLDELETNLVVEAISDSIEKEVTPELITTEKPVALAVIATAGLSSFSQWMLKRNEEVGFTSEPSSFATTEVASESPQELIDRFIQTSPKITPKKVADYSTENLAKESLVEDESLITETMARIYAQQGKVEKARRAYRLLGLKYPEKSVYFAAQLKKLGKKAN